MKKLVISTLAAALAMSFAVTAEAAASKQKMSADVQASCKAQAAKKFSAIDVLKRRDFVNDCIAKHASAKAKPAAAAQAAKPATAKPTTTGQAPKKGQ